MVEYVSCYYRLSQRLCSALVLRKSLGSSLLQELGSWVVELFVELVEEKVLPHPIIADFLDVFLDVFSEELLGLLLIEKLNPLLI